MKKLNYLTRLLLIFSFFSILIPIDVHAASASITASKTTAYVGDKVTITVKSTAGSWNLKVSGSGINDKIVGYDMDGNKTTTKTYTLNTSKAGTYKVTLSGDITDYNTEVLSNISKSVTVTVKTKPATTNQGGSGSTTTKPKTETKTETKTPTKTEPEKVSEITRFEVIGYDIDFNKDKTDYELEIDKDLKKLYIIVEGKNITVTGNKEVNIIDKDQVKVTIKGTKETKDYIIKLNKKVEETPVEEPPIEEPVIVPNEEPKENNDDNNNNMFMISTIILAVIVLGETIYIIKNRK